MRRVEPLGLDETTPPSFLRATPSTMLSSTAFSGAPWILSSAVLTHSLRRKLSKASLRKALPLRTDLGILVVSIVLVFGSPLQSWGVTFVTAVRKKLRLRTILKRSWDTPPWQRRGLRVSVPSLELTLSRAFAQKEACIRRVQCWGCIVSPKYMQASITRATPPYPYHSVSDVQ